MFYSFSGKQQNARLCVLKFISWFEMNREKVHLLKNNKYGVNITVAVFSIFSIELMVYTHLLS